MYTSSLYMLVASGFTVPTPQPISRFWHHVLQAASKNPRRTTASWGSRRGPLAIVKMTIFIVFRGVQNHVKTPSPGPGIDF